MNTENSVHPEEEIRTTQIGKADQKLTGIRGWLIFVVIGLIYAVFANLANANDISEILVDRVARKFLFILYFEVACNVFFVCAAIVALILLFLKKAVFPKYIIAFYVLNAGLTVLDIIWASAIGIEIESFSFKVMQAVLPAIIWSSYFIMSKRVKNTFIN